MPTARFKLGSQRLKVGEERYLYTNLMSVIVSNLELELRPRNESNKINRGWELNEL